MTEKRFTIKPQDDLFGVVDNYSADKVCVINGIRTEIEAEWLCKDMNTLNDENEQLKSRVEYLERKIDRERTSYQKQHEKWEEEIQKENEQLKSKNRGLQSELQIFKEDITHSNLQINKLADENEMIRNTINEMYKNERTQLGKSVLKQLIEAIQ